MRDRPPFAWKQPPYEYETVKLPIDILAGGTRWREQVEAGIAPGAIVAGWRDDLDACAATLAPHRHPGYAHG